MQELARYNRLLSTLRTSLTQLGRAVAGLALLSAELEGVLQAVEAGQVPAAWKVSRPMQKQGSCVGRVGADAGQGAMALHVLDAASLQASVPATAPPAPRQPQQLPPGNR